MSQFIFRALVNAIALVASTAAVDALANAGILPNRILLRGIDSILVTAVVFGVVNASIKPLVLVLTCLINVITLGLFTLVVNALMLYVTAWLVGVLNSVGGLSLVFQVEGFGAALVGALIISLVSMALSQVANER